MIVRTQTVRFTPDRAPMPRKIRIGLEGDNMVERLSFKLPRIAERQTATMMLEGEHANMVILTDGDGGYFVDLTAELIGGGGVHEAYVAIDGAEGEAWNSGTFLLSVGSVPDVSGEIAERYPDAVEQMRGEMASHRAEMEEGRKLIEAEGDAAKASAEAAETAVGEAEQAAADSAAAASRANTAASGAQEAAGDGGLRDCGAADCERQQVKEDEDGKGIYEHRMGGVAA